MTIELDQQARTAYARSAATLEASGFAIDDVTRVVEYVSARAIDRYAEAAAARSELFGGHRPAVNTVVVQQLFPPDQTIEVELTAGGAAGVELTASGGGETSWAPARRAADGTIYLSTLLPIDGRGELVAAGDLVGQTRFVFERAASILDGFGLDTRHVVKTVDYTTPATLKQYKATGAVRRDLLAPPYPGAAGILMERLHRPGVLVAVDVTASIHQPEVVNPGWSRYEKLTYQPALRAGNALFMSGFAALDPATERAVHEGDVVAQAEFTYGSILTTLQAAGLGPEHLVSTVEYVTPAGLGSYDEVARVRARLLAAPYPALTRCVCALLLRPQFQIEIDPFAVFPP